MEETEMVKKKTNIFSHWETCAAMELVVSN